jgi:hypothetical protein
MQITKEFLDKQIEIAEKDTNEAQMRIFQAFENAGYVRGILETAQHLKKMLEEEQE